jgi:tetratricopeptide (TPR) repeat protein
MIPIPPVSHNPNPALPVEETPAPPAEATDGSGASTSGGSVDLLATLGGLFRLHPDVRAAADPTRLERASREFAQGEALLKAGRYADALEHFEKAHSLVPHSANLFNQGLCLERLGRHEEAAKRYEAYVAAEPKAADAGTVKAHAADLHAKARSLASAAYERGNAAMRAGRYDDAASAFREARDHLPSSAATYMVAKCLDLAGASAATVVREYQRYLNEAPGADDARAVRDRIHALLEATGNGLSEPK